jgi:hypothetical protein
MIRAAVIDNGLPWMGACYPACSAIDFARVPARSAHTNDLHRYNDALTHWLCNVRPSGPFTVERRWYAVRNFRPAAATDATESAAGLLL